MDPSERPAAEGHETRDVSIPAIVKFGAGLLAVAIVIHVAVWGLFRFFEARERKEDRPLAPMVAAGLKRTPPEPRLEADPVAPRMRQQARENAVLMTYGWVDRGAGVVRLPIERAMDLLVERGLPAPRAVTPAPAPLAVSR